jgi:hypothetical protein
MADSGELSAGANRIWEGPREARISMFSCARMSADRQGVSSQLGRTSRHRKGEEYLEDSKACRTALRMSAAMYSGFATQEPVHL